MPITVSVYRVQVSTVFMAASEMFYPGQDYWVSPDVYNSKIPDGRNFSDLCATAVEETQSYGP